MFEKESDAYIKKDGTKAEQIFTVLDKIDPLKITPTQAAFLLAVNRQAFQDGAEFGYNKAEEELTERLEEAIEIIEFMKDLFFDCWQKRGFEAIKFEQKVNDFLKGE